MAGGHDADQQQQPGCLGSYRSLSTGALDA